MRETESVRGSCIIYHHSARETKELVGNGTAKLRPTRGGRLHAGMVVGNACSMLPFGLEVDYLSEVVRVG